MRAPALTLPARPPPALASVLWHEKRFDIGNSPWNERVCVHTNKSRVLDGEFSTSSKLIVKGRDCCAQKHNSSEQRIKGMLQLQTNDWIAGMYRSDTAAYSFGKARNRAARNQRKVAQRCKLRDSIQHFQIHIRQCTAFHFDQNLIVLN